MGAEVVQTARWRPGKCAINKDTTGPFIDTKIDIPRYGRVYLSISGLRDILRDQGFLTPEESEGIREDNARLQEEVRRLTEVETNHQELVDAVTPYIEVETETIEVSVPQVRAPSDEEIEQWIRDKGGNHPAVLAARPHEKGSSEEWRELYGDTPPGHPMFSKPPSSARKTTLAQELASENAGNVVQVDKTGTFIVEVKEQDVDLYKVLDQNVNDVLAWAEGHEDSVQESLLDAEYHRAREAGKDPRKSLVEGLGFEYIDPEDYEYTSDEQTLDLTGLDDGDGVGEDDEDLGEDEES